MADKAYSDPMVISSNRFNDLRPYCDHIYHHDPQTWSDIFPWEFPQNADRETEEAFLRQYFTDHEIHMQGGAHGEGAGFRFLKQVWYSIALYNLDFRVPAFTDWWLAKPSSVELLNDPQIQPFLFRDDVQVSTFFSEELATYGEKFLSVVIPYLRKAAKELLEKQQAETKPTLVVDTSLAQTAAATAEVMDASETTSLPPAAHPVQEMQSAPVDPTQAGEISKLMADMPQSAPPVIVAGQGAYTHSMQEVPVVQPSAAQHSRKRVSGGSQRFNNRGGSVHPQRRQAPSFSERNAQMYYSSPMHGPSPAEMHHQHRIASGGAANFTHPGQQNQPNWPLQGQFALLQYGQSPEPTMHPSMAPEMQYGQGLTQPFFNNLFADRSNQQHSMRAFNGEQQAPLFPLMYPHGTYPRHNSQGSRGGKYRGHPGTRGRGSRGRNSFASSDRPYFNAHGENVHPDFWGDPRGNLHLPKNRRGSVVQEKNWRSGSDDPQAQQAKQHMLENVTVNQPYPAPHPHFVPPAHLPGPVYATAPPTEADIERVHVFGSPYRGEAASRAASRTFPSKPDLPDTSTLRTDQRCGPDWIGEHCTYVDRLIAFYPPSEANLDQLFAFFSAFGRIQNVANLPAGTPSPLIFINFPTPADARSFWLKKPATWPDGRPLKVEVPKQFWDRTHKNFIFDMAARSKLLKKVPDGPSAAAASAAAAAGSATAPAPVPSILKRPQSSVAGEEGDGAEAPVTPDATQSTDTTPTPSRGNTPKKNKKKGKGKKKDQEDLRKASISTMKGEHQQPLQKNSTDDDSDTAASVSKGVVHEADKTKVEPVPTATDTSKTMSLAITTAAATATDTVQKQRSASEQTERQTASEPAFTPVDVITTRLPAATGAAKSTQASDGEAASQIETSRSISGVSEMQTGSEPAFTPADDVVTKLPDPDDHSEQPFREGEKAGEEAEAQAAHGDGAIEPIKAEIIEVITPIISDDGPADASAPTASASPDSVEVITLSKNEPTKETIQCSVILTPATVESVPASSNENTMDPPTAAPPDESDPGVVADHSGKKPQALTIPPSATCAESPALPTSVWITAPTTPVPITPAMAKEPSEEPTTESIPVKEAEKPEGDAVRESPKVDERGAEPTPPKKAEKPKGPAQTESLSLFGKKKEKDKKPKGGKKGTLKGKPKGVDTVASSEADDGGASRIVNRAAIPSNDVPSKGTRKFKGAKGVKDGGEEMLREDSKFSDKSAQATRTGRETERAMAEDLSAATPITTGQEASSPSKRKGLSGLLSGIFGGGQQSLPNTSPGPTSLSKNMLTTEKAQDQVQDKAPDLLPKTESLFVSDGSDDDDTVSDCQAVTAPPYEAHWVDSAEDLAPKEEIGIHQNSGSEGRSTPTQGLRILTKDAESPTGAMVSEKKKATMKKRKKAKTASMNDRDAASAEQQEPSTPLSATGALSKVFRFGQRSATDVVESTASVAEDDESDGSSHTLGHETPTSDSVQSPTSSTPAQKLPARSGQSQVVVAKSPRWKQKRRVWRSTDENVSVTVADEGEREEKRILLIEGASDGSEEPTIVEAVDTLREEKLYIYVGPGLREEEGRFEVEQSRARMRELATEELARRRVASKESESKEGERGLGKGELSD